MKRYGQMKKIKDILLNACAYTVILLTVFFLFIVASGSANLALTFSSYIAILAIGCVISLSSLVFGIRKLIYPLRLLIHFFVLLASLFALLFSTGFLANKTPSSYIVLIFAYAIVYALIWLVRYLIKRVVSKLRNTSSANPIKLTEDKEKQKSEYKPLYK